jgi:hypothetical protein
MAYPHVPMPTLGEFLAKAAGYGVTVGQSQTEVMGPKGKLTFRYARNGDGPAVVISDTDADVLTPTTLSNLCRQLRVPPDEFGLVLGAIADAQDHQQGGATA